MHATTTCVFTLLLHSNVPPELTPSLFFVSKQREETEAFALRPSGDLHFPPQTCLRSLSPHGWPALATGHRTADPRSSLHGDEQDLGRYPAYWKLGLLLTFRNGGGGRLLCLLLWEGGGWRTSRQCERWLGEFLVQRAAHLTGHVLPLEDAL